MMFSFRDFIRRGLLDAVGQQPDYWVILNAAGWLDKGVLVQEDLEEIQMALDEKNAPEEETPAEPETTVQEEPTAEPETTAPEEEAPAEPETTHQEEPTAEPENPS